MVAVLLPLEFFSVYLQVYSSSLQYWQGMCMAHALLPNSWLTMGKGFNLSAAVGEAWTIWKPENGKD
jgi:hypothetical protein